MMNLILSENSGNHSTTEYIAQMHLTTRSSRHWSSVWTKNLRNLSQTMLAYKFIESYYTNTVYLQEAYHARRLRRLMMNTLYRTDHSPETLARSRARRSYWIGEMHDNLARIRAHPITSSTSSTREAIPLVRGPFLEEPMAMNECSAAIDEACRMSSRLFGRFLFIRYAGWNGDDFICHVQTDRLIGRSKSFTWSQYR